MEMVNESEQEKNRIYKSQFQWGKNTKTQSATQTANKNCKSSYAQAAT